jgi:hypothetical protein
LNLLSVQWTPYDPAHFQRFEVDFENAVTNVRVVTKCAAQTTDTGQPPMPSGGCELVLDPSVWSAVANQNRGGDGVAVTVRGTTDGSCATSSGKTTIWFAAEDLLGTLYYWKSTVSASGVGGEIWVKDFGDPAPEQVVATGTQGRCNGCHALSRDGVRMVVNSDDDDSDDEYFDVLAFLIDMTTKTSIPFMGGIGGPGPGGGLDGIPRGFATFNPDHSLFLLSNGTMPQNSTNVLFLTDGVNGGTEQVVQAGPATMMVTMPDWSPDGRSVVIVAPQKTGGWGSGVMLPPGFPFPNPFFHRDDDHVFGGSLYTLPYTGNRTFGAPAPLLMSAGENNYYPSYSPDGQIVVFDRAPRSTGVPTIDGCTGTAPQRSCPNDSFSNPAARLLVMKPIAGAQPVDLENANGSPASNPVPLSNSWPKWSPFLQHYRGDTLLWVTFSSTRDYGLRVRNHLSGMYQCYPADSMEDPTSAHGHGFSPQCQQPQIWMAAVDITAAVAPHRATANAVALDPSKVAFWLPYQDMTTHNHTPQWTQRPAPPMDAGAPCVPQHGSCLHGGTCCAPYVCMANGTCDRFAAQ